MSLTDPHPALAEQSSFVGYLLGLVGVARSARALAVYGDAERTGALPEDEDMVYLLLGLTSLGDAVERLAEKAQPQRNSPSSTTPQATTRWLR